MKLIILLTGMLIPMLFLSQGSDNCSGATVLCADQTQFSSNENATANACNTCEDGTSASAAFCYDANNTVWFSFLTNATGGNVSVNISNILCDNSAGFNTSLQAVMISASSPCNQSSYAAVSNCVTSTTNNFQLNATALLPNTTYYIQVDGDSTLGDTNPAACGFNITVTGPGVEVPIDAGDGSSIFKGESAPLAGDGPSNSIWTPASTVADPTAASTNAVPNSTTTYFYSTTTANGCIYADDVTIVVQESINITNTFSPNDDGINDFWFIGSIQNFPGANVTVYDRWGQQVYHTIGYGNDKVWYGKHTGVNVPSGVYYYVIDLKTKSDDDVFVGFVTVIK